MKPLAWLLIASIAPAFSAEKQAVSRFFFRPWAKTMQYRDPVIDDRDGNHNAASARRPAQPRYSVLQTTRKIPNLSPVRIATPTATFAKR